MISSEGEEIIAEHQLIVRYLRAKGYITTEDDMFEQIVRITDSFEKEIQQLKNEILNSRPS